MSSFKKKWRASSEKEKRKLGVAEAGWNLATGVEEGRRTRGTTRKKAPPEDHAEPPINDVIPATTTADEDDVSALSLTTNAVGAASTSTTTSRSRSYSPHHLRKPSASRVLLDASPLKTMLEMHLAPCPHCRSRLEVSFPTVCVASGCQLKCPEKECPFTATSTPELTEFVISSSGSSQKIGRNTDYAANILYVVGFIASGDGGTEAARILGLLGLPNSTTMQSRSFGNIEDAIGDTIKKLGDRIIFDNLCAEVKASYGSATHPDGQGMYDLWLMKSDKLTEADWPRVKAGADMGWNQKGSGRKYNSKSAGHCFFCGSINRQPICMALCSLACATCKSWYTTHTIDQPVPAHDWCTINYEGSSQSMEPNAVLQLYTKLFKERVIVSIIICDDDSSIKAKLKWSNADFKLNTNSTSAPKIINSKGNLTTRPDHGGLPRHMTEPGFVADPNHRRKTLTGLLYKLKELPKTPPEEAQKKYEKAWQKKRKAVYDKAVAKATAEKKTLPLPFDPMKKAPQKTFKWNLTMTSADIIRITKNFAFISF